MAFIRQHMMAGDPFGGMALPSRRKGAGMGVKSKAARHRAVRFRRMARGGDPFGGMVGYGGKASGPIGPAGFNAADFFAKAVAGGKNILGKVAGLAGSVARSGAFGPAGAVAAQFLPGGGVSAAPKTRSATAMPFLPDVTGSPMFSPPGVSIGGGGRRRINPANVKALRRGLSRVRSFTRLVKSVNKLLPPAARHKTASFPKRKRR